VELDPDPALLMLGDEGQVQQILTNLLVDSLHSPFGAHKRAGVISFRTQLCAAGHILHRSFALFLRTNQRARYRIN